MYNGSWLKIENLQRFLVQFEPKLIHPDDPRWITFWRDMKKKCIEGVWFEDFGKWRYGRGNLGFYHWYTRIPDIDEENKTHGKLIKPLIRDLEFHYSYYMCEARGFSGFSEDGNYTSDLSIFDVDKSKFAISDPKYLRYFKPNGEFKEFVPPRDNLFRLHDKPVGRPLYYNDAKNFMVLGSRGGGKSLYSGLAEVKYDLVFDGAKIYTEETRLKPTAIKINVGAGMKSKSAKLLKEIETSMNNLAIDPECGTWDRPGAGDALALRVPPAQAHLFDASGAAFRRLKAG